MSQYEPEVSAALEIIKDIEGIQGILEVICAHTGMGFGAVAVVNDKRWVAAAVNDKINFGLKPGSELLLESTICNEIRQHHGQVVIDNVTQSEQWATHHTPLQYGFQSYISTPIFLKNGSFFGTLCAIDPNPAELDTPKITQMFKLYAELIAFYIESARQVKASAFELKEEKLQSELREQFIAILGHDLRSPVSAVHSVAQLLQRMPLEDRVRRLADILRDASFRMRELIENILDFARGRLGEGIILDLAEVNVNEPIGQILDEIQMSWPDRQITLDMQLQRTALIDAKRIMQLFANLLSNALTHGAKDRPVLVAVSSDESGFKLSVTNYGEPIPAAVMNNLFQPFFRATPEHGKQGLGLGLFIASEIAAAHGGSIDVRSDERATSFTLTVPA